MNVGVNNIKINIITNTTPCKKKGLCNADLQQALKLGRGEAKRLSKITLRKVKVDACP